MMSLDTQKESSRQVKKAERDAARRKDRGKKRKREVDDANDIEPVNESQNVTPHSTAASTTASKLTNEAVHTSNPNEHNSETARKSRKRSKVQATEASGGGTNSKSRFIVFVGNLPYSATDASLQLHFKKLAPFTLRHRIDPRTKRSKGFAFLEFENFDRMKTCLKLYHHSMFDPDDKQSSVGASEGETDGKSKTAKRNSKHVRRINVELTAGGGGSTEARKEKIRAKNARLEEQRQRRAELERKERSKKEVKNKSRGREDPPEDKDTAQAGLADIHPSRLAQVSA